MSDTTGIQWTDATWNVVTGCTKVSAGCKHCYAERDFHRPYPGRDFTDIRFHADRLEKPLRWRRPRKIFVNSLSDLFHERVTNEQIAAVFGVMAAAPRHTFQILTKRPERARTWFEWMRSWGEFSEPERMVISRAWAWAMSKGGIRDFGVWPGTRSTWPLPNVWLGVSVENQETTDERIPLLLQTPAAVRFVSAEPLLGPVDLGRYYIDVDGRYPFPSLPEADRTKRIDLLDWVIVGGESGPGARPCDVAWIRSIVGQCRAAGVACFVKQLGARPFESFNRKGARHLELPIRDRKGGDIEEWPADLRVREWPG